MTQISHNIDIWYTDTWHRYFVWHCWHKQACTCQLNHIGSAIIMILILLNTKALMMCAYDIHTSIHICLCAGMQFALYVFMAISLMLLRLFKSIITCYQATNRFVWSSICKTASLPPPADVSWSINKSGISSVSRHQLEYELQKILSVGWGTNYISHRYPLAGRSKESRTACSHAQLPDMKSKYWRFCALLKIRFGA